MGILNFLFIKSKAVERLDKNTIYKKYYADYPENHIFLTKEIYKNGWNVQKCFQANL